MRPFPAFSARLALIVLLPWAVSAKMMDGSPCPEEGPPQKEEGAPAVPAGLSEAAIQDLVRQLKAPTEPEQLAAQEALARDRSDHTFQVLLETYKREKDPDARLRLSRALMLDRVSLAPCTVVGRITAFKAIDAPRCRCQWGATFWATLSPQTVLRGPECIQRWRTAYQQMLLLAHRHLPEEQVAEGALVLGRDAQYDFGRKRWDMEPLEVGEEGVWLLHTGGRDGEYSTPIRYEKLPLSMKPRVEALLKLIQEERARE